MSNAILAALLGRKHVLEQKRNHAAAMENHYLDQTHKMVVQKADLDEEIDAIEMLIDHERAKPVSGWFARKGN